MTSQRPKTPYSRQRKAHPVFSSNGLFAIKTLHERSDNFTKEERKS